jgi:hypothetical protein
LEFAHILAQRGEEKKEVRRDIPTLGSGKRKENPTLDREEKENLKSATFEINFIKNN